MAQSNFIQDELLDRGIPLKRCTRCSERKSLDQFAVHTKNDRGKPRECLRPWCKACFDVDQKDHRLKEPSARRPTTRRGYLKNKAKMIACSRKCQLRSKFGMTESDYELMLASQDGKCSLCRKPEVSQIKTGGIKKLSIDHDHLTGIVRALLCHHCNVGIGHFKDDPSLLRAAADYIEHHKNASEIDI